LEFAINIFYINFEKKLFLLLSGATAIICVLLCIQYFNFLVEINKMQQVKQEYHHHLAMLKKVIQDKNYDVVTDDLDTLEDVKEDKQDNDSDKQATVEIVLETPINLVVESSDEDDTIDEQDEEPDKFEFISAADEKQLKDLRKETRQAVVARKKAKLQPKKQTSLGAKQIAQLQKNISKQATQDFVFHWPLELHSFWLSSLFGARKKANGQPGFHKGVDMAAMKGTPVKAAAAGTVVQAQYLPGYGNNILIQHNKYYRTRYAHLNRIHVSVGQKVAQGQKIGTVGDSGSVRKSGRDASHLHFEIYHNGSHVNPLRYLFN